MCSLPLENIVGNRVEVVEFDQFVVAAVEAARRHNQLMRVLSLVPRLPRCTSRTRRVRLSVRNRELDASGFGGGVCLRREKAAQLFAQQRLSSAHVALVHARDLGVHALLVTHAPHADHITVDPAS